ncbi:MAG: drug/metabolite transporter (DMT)-like permease [Candidatus Azotimanducaceae bacterium]|jgi:drug/metabolite transporter (DMT)-like permease
MLTTLAMIAFAANSVLCRMSLGANLIDAASFSSIRLISGTAGLLFIIVVRDRALKLTQPRPPTILALAIYMVCFSFAYHSLSAGSGALLLFGFVQLTMLGTAIYRGERLSPFGWTGLAIAFSGLVYLMLPGVEAPSPIYSVFMAVAGLAWGIYSILGADGSDATTSTATNFLYATPLALLVSVVQIDVMIITWQGVLLSIASGAITSGVGYAIWYTALKHIKAISAAIIQLSVPALATFGGVLFLAEALTFRIILATVLTIGGISLVLTIPAKQRIL